MKHTPILVSFIVLFIALSFQVSAIVVDKDTLGVEPFAFNSTLRTSINITNDQPSDLTSIKLVDSFDISGLNYSSASLTPDNINYTTGVLTWKNISSTIGNLSQGESYVLLINFSAVSQGIFSENSTINGTYSNTTAETTTSNLSFTIGDNYENNNNYTLANNISTDGTEQFHTFYNSSDGSQDLDWVKFYPVPGHHYIIETRNYSDIAYSDTYIYLYDSDGTTLLQENDDVDYGVVRTSRIVWLANSSGPYYIKIKSWDSDAVGGNYSISVEKQGHLSLTLINPSSDTNVSPKQFFNFTAKLECVGGSCRNVSFTLDPEEPEDNPSANSSKDNFSSLDIPSDPEISDKLHHKELIDKDLDEKGSVKVIVKLKDEDIDTYISRLPEEKQVQVKKRWREYRQENVISKNGLKSKNRFSTVLNGLSAEVDSSEIEELLEDEDVEGIYYDRPIKPFLSSSVSHINVDDVWKQQIDGMNLTGAGQTVCIIDSGINYNHSDFGGANGFPSSKVLGGYDFANEDSDPFDEGGACSGHGSHAAGIIASEDSTYRGVAPDSKIVALKVLKTNGIYCEGATSDIIAAIDWCVNNASRFNISVISMSLGTSNFGPALPCDGEPEAASIEAAVDAGITVVAASGNEFRGSSSSPGIASPACVSDAISVGATGQSSDLIPSYSNRDWFLDILAPGGSSGNKITATDWDGTHTGKYGTSMATPHVSGIVALMQQRHNLLFNRSTSPQDIRDRLRLLGPTVSDASTPFSFTRVDAYNATLEKGVIPNTTGATPFYTTDNNPVDCGSMDSGDNCTFTWNVNASGDGSWKFFVIGESYTEINTSSKININIIQQNSSLNLSLDGSNSDLTAERFSIINITGLLVEGSGSINILENGSVLSSGSSPLTLLRQYNNSGDFNISVLFNETPAYASSFRNYTLTIQDTTPPNITVISPVNDSTLNNSYDINLSFSVSENSSCNYSIDNDSPIALGNGTSFSSTFSLYNNSLHNLTVNCTDMYNNSNSKTHLFTINDTAPPNITSTSPSGSSTDTTPTLTVNTDEPAFCAYSINDTTFSNMTNFTDTNDTTSTSTLSLSTGSYTYYVRCKDRLNNTMVSSENISFTITTASSPSGGGGGGGGGGGSSGGKTFEAGDLTQTELSLDYSEGDTVTFTHGDSSNSVEMTNIGSSYITMELNEQSPWLRMDLGETREVDLDNDNHDDVELRLLGIVGNKATLKIVSLVRPKPNLPPLLPPAPRKKRAEPSPPEKGEASEEINLKSDAPETKITDLSVESEERTAGETQKPDKSLFSSILSVTSLTIIITFVVLLVVFTTFGVKRHSMSRNKKKNHKEIQDKIEELKK